MNNIEKLAIDQKTFGCACKFIRENEFGEAKQVECCAFHSAKALQSSEPVALPTFNELSKNIDDSRFVGHPKLSALDTNNVKTGARIMYDAIYVWLKKQNTRSTVPLEKYNKLLDALKRIASETQDTNLLWWQKEARQAIVEAELSDTQPPCDNDHVAEGCEKFKDGVRYD